MPIKQEKPLWILLRSGYFYVKKMAKPLVNQGFSKKKSQPQILSIVRLRYGGGRGIRTPVGVSPNGFQGTLTTRKLENFRGR